MYKDFVVKNGLMVVLLLLTSEVLSFDNGGESFNSNFNRFRQKIPRIGRRGEGIISEYMDSDSFPMEGSLSNFFLKASKAVPRLGRRMDLSTESSRPYLFGDKHQMNDQRIDRESSQMLNPRLDSWPNFGDLTDDSEKVLNKRKFKIPKELEDNYYYEIMRNMLKNQNENLNEN